MTKEVILKKRDRVKVVKGRKFPIGLEGVVFWISLEERFGSYSVGVVKDDGEKFFIAEQNLEVIVEAPVNPFENKIVIEHGRQATAYGGAVEQDGDLPVFGCGKCGREIVKALSKKTGNKYWCEVFYKHSGSRFYVKKEAHTKEKCEAKIKDDQDHLAEMIKRDEQLRINAEAEFKFRKELRDREGAWD
jgi:hypothetical protein